MEEKAEGDAAAAAADAETDPQAMRERLKTLAGTYLNVAAAEPLKPLAQEGDQEPDQEWLLIDGETLILEENVPACNGELDVVNRLVMPFKSLCGGDQSTSLYVEAEKRGLGTFLKAVERAGMAKILSNYGKVTVFAPKVRSLLLCAPNPPKKTKRRRISDGTHQNNSSPFFVFSLAIAPGRLQRRG